MFFFIHPDYPGYYLIEIFFWNYFKLSFMNDITLGILELEIKLNGKQVSVLPWSQ